MAAKKIWVVYEVGADPLTEVEASSERSALDHASAFYGIKRAKLYALPKEALAKQLRAHATMQNGGAELPLLRLETKATHKEPPYGVHELRGVYVHVDAPSYREALAVANVLRSAGLRRIVIDPGLVYVPPAWVEGLRTSRSIGPVTPEEDLGPKALLIAKTLRAAGYRVKE